MANGWGGARPNSGPVPQTAAELEAKGAKRHRINKAKEREGLIAAIDPKAPGIARDTSRFWGPEAELRRRAARSRLDFSPIEPEWLELFALIPGYNPVATAQPGDWFCRELARDAIDFFHEELQLIEGEKANKPFLLEPWQQAIVACLFGWLRVDGSRRYREALIYVARKNGKTPLVAGLVNLSLFQDHEIGSQMYCAAADLEQAKLVWRHTAGMIVRNPEMNGRAQIHRTYKSIEYDDEGSVFKALSADSDTKHGLGAQFVAIDEIHAHKDGELVDVLVTATAAREQPLVIFTTTADYSRPSVCNTKYDYACKVRDGVVDDASFLPVIYEASIDDDWTDEAVWAKANPNLGVSVRLEYMRRQCQRAQDEPTYENTFKRLHLNIRTQQDVRWMPVVLWQACNDPVDPEALRGRECFAGLDLSTKIDLTAYALLFPPTDDDPKWRVLPRFFIPSERARDREKRDRVPYLTWAEQGLLTLTDGNVVDYDFVIDAILQDARTYTIREIAFDTWNAQSTATKLQAEGATMVEFGQGFASMSEPTKELERLVVSRQLAHGGNEILSWMASHVAVEMDPAGNVKLSKRKSTERIDGLVCLVMALGRAIRVGQEVQPSYDIFVFGAGD